MAETIKPHDLSVLAYANGFTFWHCWVPAPGEFNIVDPAFWAPVADMLRVGDRIMAVCRDHPFSTDLSVIEVRKDRVVMMDILTIRAEALLRQMQMGVYDGSLQTERKGREN